MSGGEPVEVVPIDISDGSPVSLVVVDTNEESPDFQAEQVSPVVSSFGTAPNAGRQVQEVSIETAHVALRMVVGLDGRLLQRSFGSNLADEDGSYAAYPSAGDGWIDEPALRVVHSDGNTSTDLRVVRYSKTGNRTKIELTDPQYPLCVDLYFQAYSDQDVIETWTEIRHTEEGPVTLEQFASSAPAFGKGDFYLTQFHGDWANEANLSEEKLSYGIKTLDSKLGVRAHQFRAPWFLLSKGGPAKEDSGEVFGGSLAWSGSFAFDFDIDPFGQLRALCGINPYASQYRLEPNEVFKTPRMVWGWSGCGTGELSRNLHRWVRDHALRGGDVQQPILLNNWEATYFSFDEDKIKSLLDGATELGLELFLLDDGWFGNKYPRNDDSQGLGDWAPDLKKLPNGLEALARTAEDRGLRFGIWLEPEMVNPRSELYEQHPDWVINQPCRALDLKRNQLVLDLSRPEIKEFVFGVVDRTLTENPSISFVKWDCNRYVTQPGSTYLGPIAQTHLWIDYVRNLYDVFQRLVEKHPNVEIMMCSGGGGRVDYEASKYSQTLWPSDMTDPARRIFIQWGYSIFFPAIAIASHVTLAGGHSMKFAFDVAMSGRLGMDVDLENLPPADRQIAKRAIEIYKRIREVVQLGDQYRLESPYEGPRACILYVKGPHAVLFVYSLGEAGAGTVKLRGLDPELAYRVCELDASSADAPAGTAISGQSLLAEGLMIPALKEFQSAVYALIGE